jgi:3-keto-disaccharide hydrolase/GMC oxidoreductase
VVTPTPQTIFTRDILGNYVCNSFSDAAQSGPFDVIIIGGGTFGLALAQDLFFRSKIFPGDLKPSNYRILVLEGGPLALPEHVQDLPNLQIGFPSVAPDVVPPPPPTASNPLPATLQGLIQAGLDRKPLLENWGLPWNSNVRFGGLAFCLGGRSLYWGGWSPRYLDSEMHTAPAGSITADTLWPPTVVQDLKARFFDEAAEQTGVTTSNDFINGALHEFYRQRLYQMYSNIPDAVPLAELPDYIKYAGPETLRQRDRAANTQAFDESLKLDAPLAVQIETRPGFFPFNKFSSVPLAITAARDAISESGPNNNAAKRLMIVPNCHVKRLNTRTYTLATGVSVQEVISVDTSDGLIDLSGPIGGNPNRRSVVVLAMGSIESARMALASLAGLPQVNQIGANLMVHLRKNVTFKVPVPPTLNLKDRELTALLVRCRTNIGGTPMHFHLQITASANPPGAGPGASDALLYQSVPDLDHIRIFRETAPGEIDVAIRAVGEMIPNPQTNSVTVPTQPPDIDDYGVPRATVNVMRSPLDVQLMARMDQIIDHVARNLFGGQTSASNVQPDGLGTTYHESGTLRMGDDPARSVVNADGQFHYVTNLYAGDASVLPTCGSANPVTNGIAIRRRLAKRLVPEGDATAPRPLVFTPPTPPMPTTPPSSGRIITLFDGTSLANWRMAGRGTCHLADGALQTVPSFDLGLLWCTVPMPQNYRLELEFFTRLFQTNGGVFIRFTNPEAGGAYNPAWAAVFSGFEVQIDNTGAPDGRPKHRTGAIYAVNYPNDPPHDPLMPAPTPSDFARPQDATVLAWNQYRIDVRGNAIAVNLNGVDTARYTNPDGRRGQYSPAEPTFIGLQTYSNYAFTTAFRNIRITVL